MSQHTFATRLGLLFRAWRESQSWLWRCEARIKGVQFEGTCRFVGRPLISIAKGGQIVIGDRVEVDSAMRANPLGLSQPSVLRAFVSGARLVLGPGVGIAGAALCAASTIEVGEGTIMGAGTLVFDTDFHLPQGEWGWGTDAAVGARPIRIGRGVFIGARAVVLKGVTVGDRAVIGAGTVVTRDVPAHHAAVGNPARTFLLTEAAEPRGKSGGPA
jgi:acetyltransferase-like isoleucine patch superfamily enzyme